MGTYFLNSLTLHQVGIRLLPEEDLAVAVELEGGLTDELELSQATLLLTNKRLVRYAASGHKTSVVSTALEDVDTIEVIRTTRNRQWVLVGLVFILGGLLLGLVPLLFRPYEWSPLLMALSLALIGVVFILSYFNGMVGEVVIRAGMKDIKCRMRQKALEDMGVFVQRFYELKTGYRSTRPYAADDEAVEPVPQLTTRDTAASDADDSDG